MGVLFSSEFKLQDSLDELGVFDAIIDTDNPFFINLKRLQCTEVEEFKEAYDQINNYFRNIGLLLKASTSSEHKNYKTAYKMFDFPEVSGINLGFSKGKGGTGFGPQLRRQIIKDAFEIIKTGSDQPEIFHLTSLFEENVGPDRLSDMIARLVYDNIKEYTKNIYKKLGITQERYPEYKFTDDLVKNPYKDCPILLLPKDILHDLPIAKGWDDIDRVCQENNAIRAEINESVAKEWYKMTSRYRKEYLKKYIFNNPEKLKKVIRAYENIKVEAIDIELNPERLIDIALIQLNNDTLVKSDKCKDSLSSSIEILNEFKHWVENQKGYSVFEKCDNRDLEKIVQRTLHGNAVYYCKVNNLDISPESNTGRGPVDFKISRGEDKTVIEIKLSSNPKTLHGFEVQIEEYAISEGANNKIFLLVDNVEAQSRIEAVYESYKRRKEQGENPAKIILIDAKPKESASKYMPKGNRG